MITDKFYQCINNAIGNKCDSLEKDENTEILGQVTNGGIKVSMRIRVSQKSQVITLDQLYRLWLPRTYQLTKFVKLFNQKAQDSHLVLTTELYLRVSFQMDANLPSTQILSRWFDAALGTWIMLHPSIERLMDGNGKATEEFEQYIIGNLTRSDIIV
jgi:hypothetical protein